MGTVHRCEWTRDGFLDRLPDLLRPRILAAGYHLHAEDEGKQVYIRSKDALRRSLRVLLLWLVFEDIIRSMKLTVGYVLTPQKTTVLFTWENILARCEGKRTTAWLQQQTSVLVEYLDNWFNEAYGEIEST